MMKRLMLTIGAMVVSGAAVAAPFCVVASYGKQCWYYNESSCEQAAAAVGGACIVSPEVTAPAYGAPFCVVTGVGGAQCWYYNAQQCQQAAAMANGQCVVRSN